MTVSPPIIVNDTSDPNRAGDIIVLDSVEEAVGYLEAIDVANNEYIAYDRECQQAWKTDPLSASKTDPPQTCYVDIVFLVLILQLSLPVSTISQ